MDAKNNTGTYNTGNYNAGNYNTGSCNAGSCNTGNYNAGNYNAGDYNAGDWNTGHYNAGNFCTTTDYKMFNKSCTKEEFFYTKPDWLYFNLTEWIDASEMSDEEKKDHPFFETTDGYLKKINYKDAAQEAWKKASAEEKEATLKLPNFDEDVFFEIFGIDVCKKEIDLSAYSDCDLLDELKKRKAC